MVCCVFFVYKTFIFYVLYMHVHDINDKFVLLIKCFKLRI